MKQANRYIRRGDLTTGNNSASVIGSSSTNPLVPGSALCTTWTLDSGLGKYHFAFTHGRGRPLIGLTLHNDYKNEYMSVDYIETLSANRTKIWLNYKPLDNEYTVYFL